MGDKLLHLCSLTHATLVSLCQLSFRVMNICTHATGHTVIINSINLHTDSAINTWVVKTSNAQEGGMNGKERDVQHTLLSTGNKKVCSY